jgi:hypothetical protein
MLEFKVIGGHADFIFKVKVVGSDHHSFHIKDRYSSMRVFQSMLKKNLDNSIKQGDLPTFPKKKYMGGMDDNFLSGRMTELGMFFN